MGKFRAHQAKNRRRREKTQEKRKGSNATVIVGGANGHERRGEQRNPQVDEGETAAGAAGVACASKKKTKLLTYGKEHSVLICGDGDFSFTRGVIRYRGTGMGVVATSLDSRKTVLKKYPRAKSWLPQLDEDGAQIAHCVDATRLHETLFGISVTEGNDAEVGMAASTSSANNKKKRVLFDRVVFNFPHTGKQRTHLNRNLIRDFFASTRDLVKCAADGGEVHVTLKNKRPYSDWNIRAMAKESGLVLVRKLPFDPSVFPGYGHSTTDPKAKEFDAAGAKTHVFCRARSALDDNVDESGAFLTIVKSTSMGGDGVLQATPKGADVVGETSSNNVVDSAVQNMREGGKQDEDFDRDVLNALLEGEVEEDDDDGWDIQGKAEEDLEVSTSTVGENGLLPRNGVDKGDDEVTRMGNGDEHHRGKSKSPSGFKTTPGIVRGGDNSNSKRKKRAEWNHPGTSDGIKEQRESKHTDSGESEATRVKDEPYVFQKKKAAKRRAQRKKAAEAAVADGANKGSVGSSVEKILTGGSRPKRKRGKYVRSGKKQKGIGP